MKTVREQVEPDGPRPSNPMYLPTGPRVDAPSDLSLSWRMAWTMAAIGWRVLPLWGLSTVAGADSALRCDCETHYEAPCTNKAGKHPITTASGAPRGSHSASNNLKTVESWARKFPNANYGVVSGGGRLIVDLDDLLKADELLPWWKEWGSYVETARGRHLYGLWDGPSPGNGPWGEAKSEGGYVVGPLCGHETGIVYQPHAHGQLDAFTQRHFSDLRERPNGNAKPIEPSGPADEGWFIDEQRHPWLKMRALAYRHHGWDAQRIYDSLRKDADERIKGRPVTDKELSDLAIWAEANGREELPNVPGVRLHLDDEASSEKRQAHVHEARVDLHEAVESATANDWLLSGLLRPRALGILASEEGLGKSYLRLALGMGLALGSGSFLDAFPFGTPARVLLIDEENGADEELRREDLLLRDLGVARTDFPLGRYVRYSHLGLDLREAGDQRLLLDLVTQEQPALVILDTATGMVGDEYGDAFKKVIRFQRTITERGVSILNVVHFVKPGRSKDGKAQRSDRAITEVMGHWTRPSDVVMMLSPDGEDESRLLFKARKRIPSPYNLVLARDGHASWKNVQPAARAGTGVHINLGAERGPTSEARGKVFEAIATGRPWDTSMGFVKSRFYQLRAALIDEDLVTLSGTLTDEGRARWAEELQSRQRTLDFEV